MLLFAVVAAGNLRADPIVPEYVLYTLASYSSYIDKAQEELQGSFGSQKIQMVRVPRETRIN